MTPFFQRGFYHITVFALFYQYVTIYLYSLKEVNAMPKSRYCDSCLESVSEEFGSDDMVSVSTLISIMGADLPDHLCDRVETSGEIDCSCPGHRDYSLV